MSLGRYLIGVAALLCVLGSLGVGAAAVRRYLLPDWRGAHARLAEIVTGCALLVGIMEVLGTVGLFRLVPMVVGSIAVGSALRLGLTSRSSARVVRPRAARPGVSAAVLILISVAGLVVVLLQWTGPSLRSFGNGITGADSIAYHLPHAASYAQTGQIRAIRYTDYAWLTGLYPATSELFHALGIVLMGNDVLSPGINLIWLALTLLAAWCIGSVRGFGPTSMLAAAIVMATPMMFDSNAGTADNDLLGVFFVMAALALWMRTADMPTTDTRAYRGGSIIAAVAAGLALSVKLNLLGPVGALTLAAIALTPSGRRRSATGWWIGGLVLAGGYWYARNLIAVGNPLPWFSFGVLPTPHPPPLQHGNNYSLADYATYPGILRHWLVPALNVNLGPWWPALVAAAVVGPLVCLFSKRDRVVMAAALIALASLVAYSFTPLTAGGPWGHPYGLTLNMRYGAPALTVALAVTPLALLFRSQLGRLAAAAGLTTLFVATVALRRLWTPDYNLGGAHAAVVLVLVVAVLVVLRPWSLIPLRRPLVRAAAVTLALSLVLAGVAVGYSGTRDYLRRRYTDKYGPLAVYKVWRWARGLHHAQIALVGNFGLVLRLSPLGSRRFQSRRVHGPARSAWLVPTHHQLSGLAHGAEPGALPVRGHHRQPGVLHHAARALAGGRLDPDRPRGQVGALPELRDPGLPAHRAAPPGSLLKDSCGRGAGFLNPPSPRSNSQRPLSRTAARAQAHQGCRAGLRRPRDDRIPQEQSSRWDLGGRSPWRRSSTSPAPAPACALPRRQSPARGHLGRVQRRRGNVPFADPRTVADERFRHGLGFSPTPPRDRGLAARSQPVRNPG